MIRLVLSVMTICLLTACQTTINPSESYYRESETMTSMSVDRCRVLATRQVSLTSASSEPEEQIGTLLGAALGAAVGSQIGGGDGKTLATAIGMTAGAAIGQSQGSNMAKNRLANSGIEYSVLTSKGREEVIVQHYNSGDRIVQPGQSCRITGSGNNKRVLPADYLPTSVARPATTTFSN